MADVRYAAEHMDSTVRSLEGLSGTDHHTGLPNRRRGEERLAEEAARARRGPHHARGGGREPGSVGHLVIRESRAPNPSLECLEKAVIR